MGKAKNQKKRERKLAAITLTHTSWHHLYIYIYTVCIDAVPLLVRRVCCIRRLRLRLLHRPVQLRCCRTVRHGTVVPVPCLAWHGPCPQRRPIRAALCLFGVMLIRWRWRLSSPLQMYCKRCVSWNPKPNMLFFFFFFISYFYLNFGQAIG